MITAPAPIRSKPWARLRGRRRLLVAGTAATCAALGWWAVARDAGDAGPGDPPRDARLRAASVRLYRVRDAAGGVVAPRAVLFFFGNDIGFWRPHRRLAAALTHAGYAVAGVDVRPTLARLPAGGAPRDSAFATEFRALVAGSYAELAPGRPGTPLVLVGHSLGAEFAVWLAAHGPPRATVGVVALSPGLRSHLRVSAADLLMTSEPTGPDSFSVPEAVAEALGASPGLRVAVVRGGSDKLRYADPALLAAGGARLRRFAVPLAGHALARPGLTAYVVRQALAWVLRTDDGPQAAAVVNQPRRAARRPDPSGYGWQSPRVVAPAPLATRDIAPTTHALGHHRSRPITA